MSLPAALRALPLPLLAGLLVLGMSIPVAHAQQSVSGNWPQWRGADRDGAASGFEAPSVWPEQLELVWERQVGHSDAPPVVADSRMFVFVREGDDEVVLALGVDGGETLWSGRYPAPFKPVAIVGDHGAGPFASPLVSGETLYTFGITQILSAWDTETGELRWRRTFDDEFDKVPAFYGNSVSPTIEDGKLIVVVGGPGAGAVLALDPKTGEDLWRSAGDEGPAYGSVTITEIAGTPQVVVFLQKHLVSLTLDGGEMLWQLPFKVPFDAASMTPFIVDDLVIVSSDRRATEAHRIVRRDQNGWSLEPVWSNTDISMTYSTPVIVGDRVVGFSTKKKGQVVLFDPHTGEVTWEGEPRLGENGFLATGGGVAIAVAVDGRAHVIDVGEAPQSLRSYEVANSAVWNYPLLLDRHLVVKDRSHVRVWSLTPAPTRPQSPTNSSDGAR